MVIDNEVSDSVEVDELLSKIGRGGWGGTRVGGVVYF